MFSSNLGTTISYTLKSIEKNEPYTAYARRGHFIPSGGRSSNIDCDLTETHTYESAELGTILTYEFSQFDEPGSTVEDQPVNLAMKFSFPDENISRSFGYNPTAWMRSFNSADGAISYSPSRTVNQFEYPDISEVEYSNELVGLEDDNLSEIQVKRAALSYGFGLIEYELLNGTVFSLLQ